MFFAVNWATKYLGLRFLQVFCLFSSFQTAHAQGIDDLFSLKSSKKSVFGVHRDLSESNLL